MNKPRSPVIRVIDLYSKTKDMNGESVLFAENQLVYALGSTWKILHILGSLPAGLGRTRYVCRVSLVDWGYIGVVVPEAYSEVY